MVSTKTLDASAGLIMDDIAPPSCGVDHDREGIMGSNPDQLEAECLDLAAADWLSDQAVLGSVMEDVVLLNKRLDLLLHRRQQLLDEGWNARHCHSVSSCSDKSTLGSDGSRGTLSDLPSVASFADWAEICKEANH